MTRIIFILIIIAYGTFSNVFAQTINNVNLADLKEEYIEVSPVQQVLSRKTFISVDYGQKASSDNFRDLIVKDAKGKNLEYSSAIAFVNKMKEYDYELFQVFTIVFDENSIPKYVLKRKSKQ